MKKSSLTIASLLSVLVLASLTLAASLEPDFVLLASPRAVGITTGQVAHYQVQLQTREGFSGDIALSCHTSSPWIKCKIFPEMVHVRGEAASAIPTPEIHLMAAAEPEALIGSYTIVVTGSDLPVGPGNSLGTSRTSVTLHVLPVKDPRSE
jgi:hypothetical protein